MAANTYGLTAVTWGVPVFTGFVVQSSSIATKNNVEAIVVNETGQEVHWRFDDLMNELSLEMLITTGTSPAPGAEITYNSIKYVVTACDVKSANKAFTVVSVKAKNTANITLA